MNMHRYLLLGMAGLATLSASAVEPPEGIITEPHDWECAYAYSDTTCERMMQAWANDVDLEGDIVELDACGECDVRMEKGYEGTEYMVGHTCNQIDGHEIKTETPSAPVSVFREGGQNTGWEITDWKFKRCLFVFECSTSCAATSNGPQCFITSGYYVGKWTPTLAAPCTTNNTNGQAGFGGSEDAGESDEENSNESSYP